ncbi:MAG TPA: hypothetical protein VIC53_00665 [Wenzhouxiangella sp.]
MSRSLIKELKTTTPAGLGAASWPIQLMVLMLWGLTVVGFGEMWVFKDMRLGLASQGAQLLQLDQALDAARKNIQAPPANQTPSRSDSRQEHIEALRQAYARLGPLPAASVWLDSAEQLASQLSVDGVIETKVWRQSDSLAEENDSSHRAPWLDGQKNNPHLQAISAVLFSAKLEGDVIALLTWLDGVMRGQGQGRVWLHQLEMVRASGAFQMELVFGVVGLAATQQQTTSEQAKPFVLDAVSDSSWRESLHQRWHKKSYEKSHEKLSQQLWGRGHRSPDWWRALPLTRLDLVGTGHMDGVSWAWVLDPRGDLHQLFVDTSVARPPQRVVAIESWGVSLLDLATETPLAWEIGQR